jgi:hypothetical protein
MITKRRGRKTRGRPRINSDPSIPMRIHQQLREIIESENKSSERYNDTLLRILREKTSRIQELREENDMLKEKIRERS